MQLRPDRPAAAFDQLVGYPEPSENLQRARLHAQSTRLVNPVEQAIDEPETDPIHRQLCGQREASRTSAHDQHSDVGLGRLSQVTGHEQQPNRPAIAR